MALGRLCVTTNIRKQRVVAVNYFLRFQRPIKRKFTHGPFHSAHRLIWIVARSVFLMCFEDF
jgi:hypothetical protein